MHELDSLPSSVDNFSGYSELPTKDECDEIYASLFELYQSNEDVEANKALLQRVKEVKHWYRKLLKKIRNRKNTSISDSKKSIGLESPDHEPVQDDDDDDIFISDEDLDEPCHNAAVSSDDEEHEEEKLEDKYEFYLSFYENILKFIAEYIGDETYKDFVTGRKKSSDNPFVFEVFQSNNNRKQTKKKGKKKRKTTEVEAERKRTISNASLGEKPQPVVVVNPKLEMEQKKEMKAKIKELLPLDPPKPTVSLDDPEYHIVEVNGVYKKVRLDKEIKQSNKLKDLLEKRKHK